MPNPDFNVAALTWDEDPAKIARSAAIAEAIAREIPLETLEHAVDFGCGTGQVTWHLADKLQSVTLVDTSPAMIAAVEDMIDARPEYDSDRFSTRIIDFIKEPLPDNSVDLIYASLSLHHVDNVPEALNEFRGVLRHHGYVAIADLDLDSAGHFHEGNGASHHGFDRKELANMLIDAGFEEPTFTDATIITKDTSHGPQDFNVFLAVTRPR